MKDSHTKFVHVNSFLCMTDIGIAWTSLNADWSFIWNHFFKRISIPVFLIIKVYILMENINIQITSWNKTSHSVLPRIFFIYNAYFFRHATVMLSFIPLLFDLCIYIYVILRRYRVGGFFLCSIFITTIHNNLSMRRKSKSIVVRLHTNVPWSTLICLEGSIDVYREPLVEYKSHLVTVCPMTSIL